MISYGGKDPYDDEDVFNYADNFDFERYDQVRPYPNSTDTTNVNVTNSTSTKKSNHKTNKQKKGNN